MNRILVALALTTMALSAALLCGCSNKSSSPPAGGAQSVNDYQIEIEGTDGLELDLLIISKPERGLLDRESLTVTVPYSRKLEAVQCAVWVDCEYRGIEGDFTMSLIINGDESSVIEARVEQGHWGSGQLSDF